MSPLDGRRRAGGVSPLVRGRTIHHPAFAGRSPFIAAAVESAEENPRHCPDRRFMSVDPTTKNTPSSTLAVAVARHGVALDDDRTARLDHYCRLLWDWNEKLNLTRHTTYDKFVARDVLDSLALAAAPDEDVLDFGSGGGVPGIVLAILRPDISMSLSDSVGKKAKVLAGLVTELGLDLPVHHTGSNLAGGRTLRHGRHPGRGVAGKTAYLGRAALALLPSAARDQRASLGSGTAKGPPTRAVPELLNSAASRYLLPGANHPSVVLEIKPRGNAPAGENENRSTRSPATAGPPTEI